VPHGLFVSYAFAYARVSTEKQDLEMQVWAVEKWASAHGVVILDWFVDHGVSGATPLLERPGFKKLVEKLKTANPRPKLLLVYDVTRLARSVYEFFQAWHYIENELDLALIPVRDIHIINVTLEYRNAIKAFLAAIAELEREFISRRTRDGLAKARAQGKISNVVERLKKENPQLLEQICAEYRQGTPVYRLVKKYREQHGLSEYAVRRILAEYCSAKGELTCPRCLHLMQVKDKITEITGNNIRVRTIYKCPKCSYIIEKVD